MQKKILVLILIVILAVALCACGSMSGMTRPLVAPGAEMKTIEGEVKAEISGDKIIVSATTNIIDGAIIKLSIHTTNGAELASTTVTKNGDNLKAEFNASVSRRRKIILCICILRSRAVWQAIGCNGSGIWQAV